MSHFKIVSHGLSLISKSRLKLTVGFRNDQGRESTFVAVTEIGEPFNKHVIQTLKDFGLQGDPTQLETIKKLMLSPEENVLDREARFDLVLFPDSGNIKSVEKMLTAKDLDQLLEN